MPLPQVDLPLFEIEIPPTKQKVNFRPFLVKEEKILILASESGDVNDMMRATQQVVSNCSMGEVDATKLPLFALQKVFMDLRSASISNIIDLNLVCGHCSSTHQHELDLQQLEIKYNKEHKNPVDLGGIMIELDYPSADILAQMFNSETIEDLYVTASHCIKVIYDGDEIINSDEVTLDEKLEWIEGLTTQQFLPIREFLETMPILEHTIEFTCNECEKENYMTMNGYSNFFV
jgi:hypothetical protein